MTLRTLELRIIRRICHYPLVRPSICQGVPRLALTSSPSKSHACYLRNKSHTMLLQPANCFVNLHPSGINWKDATVATDTTDSGLRLRDRGGLIRSRFAATAIQYSITQLDSRLYTPYPKLEPDAPNTFLSRIETQIHQTLSYTTTQVPAVAELSRPFLLSSRSSLPQ